MHVFKLVLGGWLLLQVSATPAKPCVQHAESMVYPILAWKARIQGAVIVHIRVDESGHAILTKTSEGNQLLVAAAERNILVWKFRTTNEPVEPFDVIYDFYIKGEPVEDPRPSTRVLFDFPNRVEISVPPPVCDHCPQ
jgi:Gram-negative bacterial TonB protein C-terminal